MPERDTVKYHVVGRADFVFFLGGLEQMFCVRYMIRLSANDEAEGYFFDIIDSLEEISRREN